MMNASEILGSPELAGVKVNPWGTAKRGLAVAAKEAVSAATPRFGRLAYVAVTEREVALVTVVDDGFGSLGPKLGEVVSRAARAEVVSAELGGTIVGFGENFTLGLSIPLTVRFAAGSSWSLEVPRLPRIEEGGSPLNPKRARAVVALLQRKGANGKRHHLDADGDRDRKPDGDADDLPGA